MKFAEKLSLLRTQSGYSQEALAAEINVTRQTISKWELGTSVPDVEKIITISNFFNVSIDYLLKDDNHLNDIEHLNRITVKLFSSALEMEQISKELVNITMDGVIEDDEKKRLSSFVDTLNNISLIIDEIKNSINYT